jgi:hypothetical protein
MEHGLDFAEHETHFMKGYFLVAWLLIYFAVAFVLPSHQVWKQTGANPVTFRSA